MKCSKGTILEELCLGNVNVNLAYKLPPRVIKPPLQRALSLSCTRFPPQRNSTFASAVCPVRRLHFFNLCLVNKFPRIFLAQQKSCVFNFCCVIFFFFFLKDVCARESHSSHQPFFYFFFFCLFLCRTTLFLLLHSSTSAQFLKHLAIPPTPLKIYLSLFSLDVRHIHIPLFFFFIFFSLFSEQHTT